MTNAIIISVIMQTNWGMINVFFDGRPSTQSGDVYRSAMIGFKDGTNLVPVGTTFPVFVGTVIKTNGVVSGIIPPRRKL